MNINSLILSGAFVLSLGSAAWAGQTRAVELCPVLIDKSGVMGMEYWSGKTLVGRYSDAAPAGVELLLPGAASAPVQFRTKTKRGGVIELGPVKIGALTVRLQIERINPSLIKRTLIVTAVKPQQFAASFDFFPVPEGGSFATFASVEPTRKIYDTIGEAPEYPQTIRQTFPMAAFRSEGRVFGVVADAPANWENRCLMLVDPAARKLAVMTGDGRASYPLIIKHDANGAYQYQMDGWQSLAAGETRSYETWLFADKAESHYDVQLAAHIALANAKGWNHSAVEAILRNTSYLLCRRNLMRDESRYLFISGIGYGWKQWMEQQVGPFEKLHHPWNQWWPEFLDDRYPPAFVRKVRDAQQKGELTLRHRRGVEGTLAIVEGVKARGDIAMPRTYITGLDPLNADDVNWTEVTSRFALVEFQTFLKKNIPGFENCVLERVADTISLRGGRYIQIDPPITPEQVNGGAKNADCVYVFSRNDGHVFETPYRAFLPQKVDNLFVVGKATGGGRVMGQAHCILF